MACYLADDLRVYEPFECRAVRGGRWVIERARVCEELIGGRWEGYVVILSRLPVVNA